MASIVKRGKYWRAQVRRKGFDPLHGTFDTKKEAETWAATVESKMLRHVYRDSKAALGITLTEALDRYEREVTPRKKGSRQERSRIAGWKAHPLAARPLGSLSGADFAKYRDDMRTSKIVGNGRAKKTPAENSIRLNLALVSHLFTVARKEWGFEGLVNPMDAVTKPTGSQKRNRRMSDAELRAIIATDDSKNKVLSVVLQLALETAMRRSELVKTLEWHHIDIDARVAHLPDTKGGVPRNVPLSATALALLRGLPKPHNGHVFEIKRDDKRRVSGINPDGITLAFRRVRKLARAAYERKCEEAGEVPDTKFLLNLRFHDARHEATSTLFEKGFNVMEAAAVTGHKDLKTLMRYTHLNASKLAHRLDGHGPADAAADHPHPGKKLREYLPNSSRIALVAKQIGVPKRELIEVVAGRARIDAELAVRLEVLGPRAELWADMQLAHDLQEVRRRRSTT